jgi:RHS repeat-associated protein
MLRSSAGVETLYVYDGLGSPVAMLTDYATQAYAYKFDPFGTAVLAAGGTGNGVVENPFLFKGGIQDRATGWIHYGNRWYNTTLGRWTQQDTLDAPLDPVNANRYAYVGADPINGYDPVGLYDFGRTVVAGLGGWTGGAVAGCITGAVVTSPGGPTAAAGCVLGGSIGATAGAAGAIVTDVTVQLLGY